DPSGEVVIWRIRDGVRGTTLVRRSIRVRRAQLAPYGTQKGSTNRGPDTWGDPGDLRLGNAFYDADLNRVYAAHTIFHDLADATRPYAEAVIRWYEIKPASK